MDNSTQITPRRPLLAWVPDLWAYVLPMGIFLGLTSLGSQWESLYTLSYVLKTLMVGVALILLWPKFTKIRWHYWWLGIIVGVIGIFQWVPMQLLLQRFSFFAPSGHPFDPMLHFAGHPLQLWSFIAVRIIGAVLVVPVMEELFWRDWLWRTILAPNDFKLAAVGEWDWKTFLIVAGAFATVHGNWWLTAIGWGLLVGGLLAWTKSLGACIIAHGVTNLLLALYILYTHDWAFW